MFSWKRVIGMMAVFVVVKLLFMAFYAQRNAGHLQADMDRDLHAWEKASTNYGVSADCGKLNLEGSSCVDHWRTVVQPNLKATEAAWYQVQSQMAYEFSNRTVPEDCVKAYGEMKATLNDFYPIEDRVVATVVDGNPGVLKDLAATENTLEARVKQTSEVDRVACKGY